MKHLLSTLIALTVFVTSFAQLSISGSRFQQLAADANTGLKSVYVVENAAAATISYTATGDVEWLEFSNLGGGYAQPVPGIQKSGNVYTLPARGNDMGYIIRDGNSQLCFYIINYASHPYSITAALAGEADCDRTEIILTGEAPEMPFYSVNGHRELVDRQVALEYNTLQYNQDSHEYVQTSARQSFASASGHLFARSPLCDTEFTIVPDRFATAWGLASAVHTSTAQAVAVEAETTAVQTERDADNEQRMESESLGGSAPCEVTFTAAVTDAAIYRRWEVATDPEFVDVTLSFDQLEFTYTFTEAGNTFIRFTANNAAGTCEYVGETYTVTIGESRLDCPNAFSPGSSEGVNDEWKVSYRSIVEFDCQIFNRWGKRLATLTDPSQGWDGKVGGKTVGSGVYFYVIRARGADGKEYKLSGDINVVNSRRYTGPAAATE